METADGVAEARAAVTPRYLRGWRPARADNAANLLDTFILSAVTTILVVRIFLALTGYPQLGNQGLHIAHVLWGGLFLTLAVLLLQSLVRRPSRHLAALLGGVGFGLFIDEVGKFVTEDVNYFFRPAYSIIYVMIVVIYLGARMLLTRRPLTPAESLANALDYVKEAAADNLDAGERARALALLGKADPSSPITVAVRDVLVRTAAQPLQKPTALARLAHRGRSAYARTTEQPAFSKLVALVFCALAAYGFYDIARLVTRLLGKETADFASWATLVTGIAASVFYIVGVFYLRRDRLTAYRWFEVGLLVDILLWQVFAFDEVQLFGVALLGFHLLLFVTVRYMAHAEERRRRVAAAAGSG
jgi:hypothetical protein